MRIDGFFFSLSKFGMNVDGFELTLDEFFGKWIDMVHQFEMYFYYSFDAFVS